jgi:hypothetical protein
LKKLIGIALIGLTIGPVAAARAQVSVGVNVPGLYGRVDVGGYPTPPPVLYRQPVYVDRGPTPGEPLYLHVPPGQERHWRDHCREYDACGRPVYFVQHDWYRNVYARRGEHDRHDERGDERGGRDEHGGRDGEHDRGRP